MAVSNVPLPVALPAEWTRVLFEAIELWQAILDNMGEAVLVADASGTVLLSNPAARRSFPTKQQTTFCSGEYEPPLETQPLERCIRGDEFDNWELFVPASPLSGSRWVDLTGRPLRDAEGAIRGGILVGHDITARKYQVIERQRVEKALRDSEALFESLVESLPQNIFRKDRHGRFVFANQRFCQTVKKPLRDIFGKTDFDLFPPDLAAKYVRDDRRIIETREPFETVEDHRTPDGNRLHVQVVKTVVLDAGGQVVGVQGIFWDVTEKTIALEKLSYSEHRYRQLTEATLDGIILSDERGICLLFNAAAERMFGYAAAEVIGQPSNMLVPGDLRGEHERERIRYLEARGSSDLFGRTSEMRLRRKDGSEFPCEVTLTVLSETDDPAGPVQFLAGVRDLTERNKMRAAAVQNDKLASIGLLSAGVAHEINNPLAFVSNNLAVLERDCLGLLDLVTLHDQNQGDAELPSRWRAKAEEIDVAYIKENLGGLLSRTRDGIDRVTRIVHSLRGLARTDAPRHQEVDLRQLIDGALDIIKGQYRNIETIQSHPRSPRIACVSTQLSQVILNLLVNAFQAVESARKDGGKVWVRTHVTPDEIVLEVEDNGPGIDAAIAPKIFDPFFTTKDVGEGTGLGLSISHHIVAGHGGRLEVDGNPGRGACFRVVLPIKEADRK